MSYLKIIPPSAGLAAYVKQYIILKVSQQFYATQRLIPMGCVEVIIFKAGKSKTNDDLADIPQFFIGGNRNSYLEMTPQSGELYYISILFQPYGARLFFDLPIDEVFNQLVSMEDIEDKSWMELRTRITDTSDIHTDINLIENFLTKKLYNNKFTHMERIINSVETISTVSDIRMTALAEGACLSQKQFNRVFQNYVGYNPKEYMRLVRFNKVFNLLKTTHLLDLAQVAQEFGYSDQSHMIREFKAFAGYTPHEFLTLNVNLHHFS